MSEKIRPALTPEEWALAYSSRTTPGLSVEPWADGSDRLAVYIADACGPDEDGAHTDASAELSHEDRHALAALCLRGKPFGFTWEDVKLLQEVEYDFPRTPRGRTACCARRPGCRSPVAAPMSLRECFGGPYDGRTIDLPRGADEIRVYIPSHPGVLSRSAAPKAPPFVRPWIGRYKLDDDGRMIWVGEE